MKHMLAAYPPDTLEPGDVLITNDPWIGTGHLFDVNVMKPVFRDDRLVGFTMSITHLPDIGGSGFRRPSRPRSSRRASTSRSPRSSIAVASTRSWSRSSARAIEEFARGQGQ